MNGRRLAAVGALVGAVLAAPGTAHADAAGPTDYRTEITAVTPATRSIRLSIEGGDSFVRVVAEHGVEVVVLGYDGEPYVMIDADGDVYENVRSFAAYYNDTRYGTSEIPATVDNAADPEWAQVGSGGAWAWHDHRAHWMATDAPVGMGPGDTFPAQTIPLLVDGQRVEVEVVSTLVGGPSWIPSALGVVTGAALTIAARSRASASMIVLPALAWSAVALTVGLTQYMSLPAETEPRPIWWLAPAIATIGAALAALAARWRGSVLLRDGLVAVVAVQLLVWVGVRRLTFTRSVLPTDLPFWLDRAATAAAGTAALVLLGAVGANVAEQLRQAPSASSMAASSSS
jgi:hypothetical protein